MRKYIIVTHSYLAEGFKQAAELILGAHHEIYAYNAYTNEDDDVLIQVKDKVKEKKPDDDFIIVTDLLGGSVNTSMMDLLNIKGVYLITGANLLLVMQLMLLPLDCDLCSEIERVVSEAKEGIVFLKDVEDEDDDEF